MSVITKSVEVSCKAKVVGDKPDVTKDIVARAHEFNIKLSDAKTLEVLVADFNTLKIHPAWIPALAIEQLKIRLANAGRPNIRGSAAADEKVLFADVQKAIDDTLAAMSNVPGETREVSEKTLAARQAAKMQDYMGRFQKGCASKDVETLKVAGHIAANMVKMSDILIAFYDKGTAAALAVK